MTRRHVAILLCTYNGEKYIREQVESIIAQTHTDWSLWVSDDGSQDRTLNIIRECMQSCAQPLHIRRGPSVNSSRNFMSLIYAEDIQADYFAFSDQDDIWHPDKIARALKWHALVSDDLPNLYGGRTHLVDADGVSMGESPLFARTPCFANALVQSIAGGNTMVMNRKARELLCAVKDVDVVSHDWWAYILVSGAGGHVYYDPVPSLDYRQHGGNLVGSNMGWQARFLRIRLLMQGRLRNWTAQHMLFLDQAEALLTSHNRQILACFRLARSDSFFVRIKGGIKSGVFRQTVMGHIGLIAAILFRWV